jgi:hypothetical protein
MFHVKHGRENPYCVSIPNTYNYHITNETERLIMKITIDNVYQFRDLFLSSSRKDQFSYEALGALAEYFADYEESTGEEIEVDVIAICCEFAEDTWQNIASYYSIDLSSAEDDEDKAEIVKDFLLDEGVFVGDGAVGCFVYQQF